MKTQEELQAASRAHMRLFQAQQRKIKLIIDSIYFLLTTMIIAVVFYLLFKHS